MNLHTKSPKKYTITGLCELFGRSKQAYHKYDENAVLTKVAQEEFIIQYIHEVRKDDHGIGGTKLWHIYQKRFGANEPVGRDRFEDIVDKYRLKVRAKMRKPKTTDSTHGLPVYPNLIKDLIPVRPNELWVSDITYIPIWLSDNEYVFCYLSLILDAYTEEIVGWSVGSTLETIYPLEALRMALRRIEGNADVNIIHHSDRGVQYASNEYTSLLRQYGFQISMTENGNPKENPQAERINNTIKNEMFKGVSFNSLREVINAITSAVDFYNNERPHMSINMMTPAEAAHCTGEIQKKWKSYRLIAIKSKQADLSIAENCLPLMCVRGILPAYGLQSTPDRDKTQRVNKLQR